MISKDLIGKPIILTNELVEVLNDVLDPDFHEYEKEDQYDILKALNHRLKNAIKEIA